MGANFDDNIAQGMNYWLWIQIKRVKKLCNNKTAKNKGQGGCNPIYKFDYILKCLIHNINFLTKQSKLDIYGDDRIWATESYGEAGSGLTGIIANKPGITKSV